MQECHIILPQGPGYQPQVAGAPHLLELSHGSGLRFCFLSSFYCYFVCFKIILLRSLGCPPASASQMLRLQVSITHWACFCCFKFRPTQRSKVCELGSQIVGWLRPLALGFTGLPSFLAGVLLHVMGDALGSVIVVITAIIFYVHPLKPEDPCNWECYIDPSLTIIMVIIILSSAFPLIKETAVILLQMVPKGLNMEELSKCTACRGDC